MLLKKHANLTAEFVCCAENLRVSHVALGGGGGGGTVSYVAGE